jgi:two-component system sensor histidine kinase YesM
MESGKAGYTHASHDGSRQLIVYSAEDSNGWRYLSSVPFQEIMKEVRSIRASAIGVSLISVIICFLLSLLVSRRIVLPINNLIGEMERAQTGDLKAQIEQRHRGEIGQLERNFDTILRQLKTSINNSIAIQREKREAELRFLELQINPHFLYNALSSIVWLSYAGRSDDVIRIAQLLSDLFRISISKGKEIIPIEDELTHARNFLEIERLRYPGEFVVVHEIDNDLLGYYTIKLIMQPILENAVYHGVRKRHDGCGEIRVQGMAHGDQLCLRVMDNGEGVSAADLDRINAFLESADEPGSEQYGIGIRNVHDRIRLHYGAQFGIHFQKEGPYTVVEIRIPAVKGSYEQI